MGSPTRPWRLGRSTCIGFGRPSHMQFMPNALQACAGELARLSRLFLLHKQSGGGCAKRPLFAAVSEEPIGAWCCWPLAPSHNKCCLQGYWPVAPPMVLAKSAALVAATAGLRLRERPGLPVAPWGVLRERGVARTTFVLGAFDFFRHG